MAREKRMTTHQRILIAQRAGDGLVHVGALEEPAERIRLLQTYGVEIDAHTCTRPTPFARQIVTNVKRRFELAALDERGPWFVVEYSRLVRAVGEYDLETGERQ